MLPVVTILAGVIAFTFAGSILVEGIFGWPGVGNYSLQAIQTSDFPAIQGFVIYAAVLYVVIYEALNFAVRRRRPAGARMNGLLGSLRRTPAAVDDGGRRLGGCASSTAPRR